MTLISAEPSDAALMQAVQHGSHLALGKLYGRFARRAYGTALATCHDRECAEDAVQDAFVSMWSWRASYRPDRGPVVAWAMSIVRHRAIYLARRRSCGPAADERTTWLETQPAGDDVPSEVESRAEAARLEQLLGRLPDAQREVIRLAFFDGMTHKQIALRLSLPPGTVKGRMRLGLKKLRSGLEVAQ
ncbi:MAG TPA: sigma-70 family RNA polymerase sigma factor [Solirubrobacteraceae bacterium]|nr:sigma-70 family RNA polymerase sigma factor [Solirubrobacteraceae bacterium]